MGRKHFRDGRPARFNRHAKEIGMYGMAVDESPLPAAFGIRRSVQGDAIRRVGYALRGLQVEGQLPPSLKLLPNPELAILSKELVGKQVQKGLIKQDINRVKQKLQQQCRSSREREIEADITGVTMQWGMHLNLMLENPDLEGERAKVTQVLGWCGAKGLERDQRKARLGVTLGKMGTLLALPERELIVSTVEAVFDDIHHLEEPIQLSSWDIYPEADNLAA
jgi:hypothetical protein